VVGLLEGFRWAAETDFGEGIAKETVGLFIQNADLR
jgi:hypothetical protein